MLQGSPDFQTAAKGNYNCEESVFFKLPGGRIVLHYWFLRGGIHCHCHYSNTLHSRTLLGVYVYEKCKVGEERNKGMEAVWTRIVKKNVELIHC